MAEASDGDRIVHHEFDTDQDDPATAVAEAVADLRGEETTDLTTMYDQIDHMIDHLFSTPPDPGAQVQVEFTFEGYRITIEQDGTAEFVAPNAPVVLGEQAQGGFPRLSDAAILERIAMPVLLLQGARSHPFYAGVIGYLAERLGDASVREVPGAGHLGPVLAPEPVASELVRFLPPREQRV
jgi:pimeloyl-ACP methyl ester carboxylesterase